MNLTLIMIGNTSVPFVTNGYETFKKRISHYINFNEIIIPDLKDRKSLDSAQIKTKEATLLKAKIPDGAYVVLLDERGKELTSIELASFMQKKMNSGIKEMVFIIGGAYGVADSIKQSANYILSLSKMTFTHQFIRLLVTEQIYRSMTILRNEPYHNE